MGMCQKRMTVAWGGTGVAAGLGTWKSESFTPGQAFQQGMRWASEESQHTPWMFPGFCQPGNHRVPGGCWWPSLPVGDSLQGPAVAAGQPEGAIRQHVGAVRDAQDEQVAARRLQQGLQPSFQAAPAGDAARVKNLSHPRAVPGG